MDENLIFKIIILLLVLTAVSGCTNSEFSLYSTNDDEKLINLYLEYYSQNSNTFHELVTSFEKRNFKEMEFYSKKGLDDTNKMIFEIEQINPSSECSLLKSESLEALKYLALFYSDSENSAKEFQKGNNETGNFFLNRSNEELQKGNIHLNNSSDIIIKILEKRSIDSIIVDFLNTTYYTS